MELGDDDDRNDRILGLVAWAIVALVRSPNRSRSSGNDSAEEILASRLATGEIEDDEYRQRLDLLRSSKVPTGKKS